MIIFAKRIERMTIAELSRATLSLENLHQTTGYEEYGRLADAVTELLVQRLLSEPNPYEAIDQARARKEVSL